MQFNPIFSCFIKPHIHNSDHILKDIGIKVAYFHTTKNQISDNFLHANVETLIVSYSKKVKLSRYNVPATVKKLYISNFNGKNIDPEIFTHLDELWIHCGSFNKFWDHHGYKIVRSNDINIKVGIFAYDNYSFRNKYFDKYIEPNDTKIVNVPLFFYKKGIITTCCIYDKTSNIIDKSNSYKTPNIIDKSNDDDMPLSLNDIIDDDITKEIDDLKKSLNKKKKLDIKNDVITIIRSVKEALIKNEDNIGIDLITDGLYSIPFAFECIDNIVNEFGCELNVSVYDSRGRKTCLVKINKH